MNRFAAFAYDSDSEEEVVVVKPVLVPSKVQAKAADMGLGFYYPTLKAMMDHTESWGDLCVRVECVSPASSVSISPIDQILASRENDRRCQYEELTSREGDVWAQSWSAKMVEVLPMSYDLSRLDNYEYADCMSWLYDQGWHIDVEERNNVRAWPANLPPRVWIAPIREFGCCGDSLCSSPVKVAKPIKVVQRFCRDSRGGVHCGFEGCRFVHEDTLPRTNKPCQFGKECGKREVCLFIHPDETWVEGMVLTRPPSAAASSE
jgi:hypothetical protein